MRIVVIDPGHGGDKKIDGSSPNNATGPDGTLEKHLTLEVARRAAAVLSESGHRVQLTRSRDVNLSLKNRAGVARRLGAGAFVSIHFNGFDDSAVQGTETWLHFAAREPSRALAACVQQHVVAATGYRDRRVQSKRLDVLNPADHAAGTAACLAEISFITDPADEDRLRDETYLDQLGGAIAAGVVDYFATAGKARRVTRRPAAAPKLAKRRVMPAVRAGAPGDAIHHVVVLMLENRSFDHMLGSMQRVFSDLDGVDPANPRRNIDPRDPGRPYFQKPTFTTALEKDPRHELEHVRHQLNFHGERCGGFVDDFRTAYNSPRELTQEVMGYYDHGELKVLHHLASEFTICDRWFSSVPGPTWTNRLFVHSGTSQGRVAMPTPPFDLNLHRYNQQTLYDRLNERKIKWRIYYGDVPQSLVLEHQRAPANAVRYRLFGGSAFTDSFEKAAAGSPDDFPAYVFIEPNYFLHQNDQHPPSDVTHGEVLIARVYNALRRNEALWRQTLLVVLYDEHGGFYDHVYPGPAPPPDEHREEYSFDQFGVRVPALLISPWVGRGPCKTELDHTSLIRFVSDKWRLGPLGERAAHANSFDDVLLAAPRTDTPEHVPEPDIPKIRAALASPLVPPALNDLQRALLGLTDVLERETVQPAEVKIARAARILEGPAAQTQIASDRVERFLEQQRAAERGG